MSGIATGLKREPLWLSFFCNNYSFRGGTDNHELDGESDSIRGIRADILPFFIY
jgi:hypothetical protein